MKRRRKTIRLLSASVVVLAFLLAWGTVGAMDIAAIPDKQGYIQLGISAAGLLLGWLGLEVTA